MAVALLSSGEQLDVVRETADVSWAVLESWIFDSNGLPVVDDETAELVNNLAEQSRQARRALTRRRDAVSGRAYDDVAVGHAHLREELAAMKQEYLDFNGHRCVPYSQYSTDEIDRLEGIVNEWFG